MSTASKILSHSGFGSYTFDGQDEVTATVKKGTDPYHMMGISELVSEVGYTRDGTQYIVTSTGKNLHGYIDYSMDGYVVVMKPKKSSLTKGEFMDIINTFQRVTPVELENKITISPESRSREVEPLKITTLRIGYQPHILMIAEMVAAVKGWWKEDLKPLGIEEIKEFEFPSGPPEMQAMYAGELDVAYVGTAPPIAAISQGLDAKIVAAINVNGSNLVFRTGKDYQSPSSLEGLSIATFPPGSIQDTIIKKWLTENNVDLSKVKILPMGPGDAVDAIEAGKVDGVFLPQPSPALIELDGKGKSVAASGEMWPKIGRAHV